MNVTTETPTTARARYRELSGPARWIQVAVLSAIPVLGLLFIAGVHTLLGIRVYTEQWLGLFLSLCLTGTFLTLPARRGHAGHRVPWYDAVLAVLSLPSGLFLTVWFPEVVATVGQATVERTVLGALAIVLILEAVRRLTGWMLVGVVVAFLAYAAYGDALPGTMRAQSTDWPRLLNYLYLDPNSFLSLLGLAASIGVAFITLGQVLLRFGAGDSLTNLALCGFGRFRGGSAKGAVVGSSLIGTVTGAPMSNVYLTGSVTIPMMIRTGYPRATAAGIEAVSSMGGQIMPPVMGIAAFVMAERLGISYAEVAVAALIPAVLFYVALFVQIDLTAGRLGLGRLAPQERPSLWPTLRRVALVVPALAVLVYAIFVAGADPSRAAALAAVVAVPVLILAPEYRKALGRAMVEVLERSGRLVLDVAAVLAAAGVVVGVVSLSGLGFNLSYQLLELAGGSLVPLLLVTAAGSIVLGMGMPSVAAYALVAVLFAPALVDFGIPPLAAHLFIFYFAVVSNITPPIAVAAFAAAPLAETSATRTAVEAMRIGVLIYLVPFMFVFTPGLLLQEGLSGIVVDLLLAPVGIVLLGGAVAGYLHRRLTPPARVLLAAAGVALLLPLPPLATAAAGAAAATAAAAVQAARHTRTGKSPWTALRPFVPDDAAVPDAPSVRAP